MTAADFAGGRLTRDFYDRGSLQLAPLLLNKLLVRGSRIGRIVEVEAYCGDADPAAHSYRGVTKRNAAMFGPPGHLYVYFTYGMHWCANVVCGPEGAGLAVLLRAVAPLSGLPAMRRCRPAAKSDRDLCSGPAKLSQAFGITGAHDGADLAARSSPIYLADDGTSPPPQPACGIRVGISAGVHEPWRWWVRGDPNVSRPSGASRA